MSTGFKQEVFTQAAHSAPSIAMIYAWLMSISLDQWYKGAGTCFILLQTLYLLWKWRKEVKKNNET